MCPISPPLPPGKPQIFQRPQPPKPLNPPCQGRFVCPGDCTAGGGTDCWECFRPEDKPTPPGRGRPLFRDSFAIDTHARGGWAAWMGGLCGFDCFWLLLPAVAAVRVGGAGENDQRTEHPMCDGPRPPVTCSCNHQPSDLPSRPPPPNPLATSHASRAPGVDCVDSLPPAGGTVVLLARGEFGALRVEDAERLQVGFGGRMAAWLMRETRGCVSALGAADGWSCKRPLQEETSQNTIPQSYPHRKPPTPPKRASPRATRGLATRCSHPASASTG